MRENAASPDSGLSVGGEVTFITGLPESGGFGYNAMLTVTDRFSKGLLATLQVTGGVEFRLHIFQM